MVNMGSHIKKTGRGGRREGAGRPRRTRLFVEVAAAFCPYCAKRFRVSKPKHKQELRCSCGKVSFAPQRIELSPLSDGFSKEFYILHSSLSRFLMMLRRWKNALFDLLRLSQAAN